MDTDRFEPKPNQPCRAREMVVIPTYVRLSEQPTPDGSCVTGPIVNNPAGWYVEYWIPGADQQNQYRNFFTFDEVAAV